MMMNRPLQSEAIYAAATATIDLESPSAALDSLLNLATDLLDSTRAAFYEYDDEQASFYPRLAQGIDLADLGRISSVVEQSIPCASLQDQKAYAGESNGSSLGLPLGPGIVACVPLMCSGKVLGLIFVARDSKGIYTEGELSVLEVIAARAGEALCSARRSASQDSSSLQLSLLYEATRAIAGTRDRHETMLQTAAHLIKATSADICDVLVKDVENNYSTRIRHEVGEEGQEGTVSQFADGMPHYPVHDEVLSELRPARLSVTPPVGSPRDIALLQEEGLQAAAVFPLATGNRCLGLVRLLYKTKGGPISEDDMELAQALINISSVGLQDAIHLETAQTRADQLQALSDIGREMTSSLNLKASQENAMRHAQRLLGVEACILLMLDERRDKLVLKASGSRNIRIRDVSIKLEEGVAGWVATNRAPQIVNDVRRNPHYHSAVDAQTGLLTTSLLCVPLETRGELLGVIEAINHPRDDFTETDQQMLASVASWAAIAIDNSNLFRRVADEQRRLEATLVETADAVVLTDPTGRIILVNNAAAKSFSIDPLEAAGRPASEIFPKSTLGELLMSREVGLPISLEIITPRERVLHATISNVTEVGRVAVMQDITALKQIDRMRSQLLGTAAHDLKNPLNAIRLGADLLSDAPLNPQQRKALGMMLRATESMTDLITDLLETIRVESTMDMSFEICHIDELIRRALSDLKPLIDERQHHLEYERPGETLLVMGDPARLTSVISNILSNAVKFTDKGGDIRIGVDWDKDKIVVSISDNGPGIHEDEIPRIFDHLFRGRSAVRDPNNPVEGTGLGLSLAKTVVEQHGGNIWVTSKVGDGSIFYFSMPREPSPKPFPE